MIIYQNTTRQNAQSGDIELTKERVRLLRLSENAGIEKQTSHSKHEFSEIQSIFQKMQALIS